MLWLSGELNIVVLKAWTWLIFNPHLCFLLLFLPQRLKEKKNSDLGHLCPKSETSAWPGGTWHGWVAEACHWVSSLVIFFPFNKSILRSDWVSWGFLLPWPRPEKPPGSWAAKGTFLLSARLPFTGMKGNYARRGRVMFNSSEIHSLICSINIYRGPVFRPLLRSQGSLGRWRPPHGCPGCSAWLQGVSIQTCSQSSRVLCWFWFWFWKSDSACLI